VRAILLKRPNMPEVGRLFVVVAASVYIGQCAAFQLAEKEAAEVIAEYEAADTRADSIQAVIAERSKVRAAKVDTIRIVQASVARRNLDRRAALASLTSGVNETKADSLVPLLESALADVDTLNVQLYTALAIIEQQKRDMALLMGTIDTLQLRGRGVVEALEERKKPSRWHIVAACGQTINTTGTGPGCVVGIGWRIL
jgi:hypothetical protein